MTVSIVVTTYNGIKYIGEQLNSLMAQSRQAEEVIILDDCSSDGTCEFVRKFIQENRLDLTWRLIVNELNVGYKQNFINGFCMACGDIIFPCDQDDIWNLDKIKVMADAIEHNNKIMVLEGKAEVFYDECHTDNQPKKNIDTKIRVRLDKKRKKAVVNSGNIQKYNFNKSFFVKAPGCVLCFRKDYFNIVKSYWFEELPHDALLGYYAKIMDMYYVLDISVIKWRYHIGSASRQVNNKNRRMEEIEVDEKVLEGLYNFSKSNNLTCGGNIKKMIRWNNYRSKLIKDRSIISGIKLFGYLGCYTQRRRFITDWLYAFNLK